MNTKSAEILHHIIRQGPQWIWASGTVLGFLMGLLPWTAFLPAAVVGSGLKVFETSIHRRVVRHEVDDG